MKCQCMTCGFCLAMVLGGCHNPAADPANAPLYEKTVGKDKVAMEKYLNAHFVAVVPDSDKVRFMTDGSLGIGQWGNSWQSEFALGAGENFQTRPDHHSSSSFEVRNIGATGVVIKYQSRFDHQSFGKNLISMDEGEVEIAYKEKK